MLSAHRILYLSSSAAAYCNDKNIPSGFCSFCEDSEARDRHVEGEAVLRRMWHVASERYRIVCKRLVGMCGCVLWMVG
jgi:hypothetical protein